MWVVDVDGEWELFPLISIFKTLKEARHDALVLGKDFDRGN